MTYNAAQLIFDAYTLSGVVAIDFNTVSGSQQSEGLRLLNTILAIKSANVNYIPYYQEYDFNAVINQESYFIPNLVSVESFTFNQQTIRFESSKTARYQYRGTTRADNISSLPFTWRAERTKGGTNISIYPLPVQEFPLKIWGKFSLSSVTLFQDLSLTLDTFYIEYLRYELAQYICSENNVSFQSESEKTRRAYRKIINQIATPDLRIYKKSSFASGGINWAFINLSPNGWVP